MKPVARLLLLLASFGPWLPVGQVVGQADATDTKRPQEPRKPYPYDEEEVTFENKKAGVRLAGTLTLPRSRRPFAAVLLVTGSGPQDRDETVFGHRPFLVLADYLTRRGLAVLRYDDRGVGQSTGDRARATSADYAEDARAGVEYLRSRRDVNPKQVGIIGHSEGANIAAMLAAQSSPVAFIVMLAGQGVPGEEISRFQNRVQLQTAGFTDKQIANTDTLLRRLHTVLREEKDDAAAQKRAGEVIAEEIAKLSEEDQKAMAAIRLSFTLNLKQLLVPWVRYWLVYDPRSTLKNVQCPVLALIGEKDLQVPPRANLPEIEKALRAAGNKDYTVKELPGLNHLFQTCQTGAYSEYQKIEETIAPAALELLADWISKRTVQKP